MKEIIDKLDFIPFKLLLYKNTSIEQQDEP
jgi:hypothetical protein